MLFLYLYYTLAATPPYSFDFTTSTLTISKCADDLKNCVIDQDSYQKSGPYQTYITINIEFGPNSIGYQAFKGSTALQDIIISASITSIGNDFTRDCGNLRKIMVSNQSVYFESDNYGSLYSFGKTTLLRAPTISENIVLNQNIKKIIEFAFHSANYKYLLLPSLIETISNNAFADSSINHVEFSNNSIITTIECFFFNYIHKISLPNSVTTISGYGFQQCMGLTTLVIYKDSKLSSISANAFKSCSKLKSIELPSKVTSIPNSCFKECSKLETIFIPAAVSSIDSTAFAGCLSLSNITLGGNDHYVVIQGALFKADKTEVVVIPATAKVFEIPEELLQIGQTSLQLCENLTQLEIPSTHPKFLQNDNALIDKNKGELLAFVGGTTTVEIPDSVKTIKQYTFYKLSKISIVEIPDSVTLIEERSFSESSIEVVTIPSSVSKIYSYTFAQCKKLKTVNFPKSGSISFDREAFAGTTALSELRFTCTVKSVGYISFSGCGAKKIIFEVEGLTSTFSSSFSSMLWLESVELPASLTTLEYWTFGNCGKLKTISFPRGNNIEVIKSKVFEKCSSLESFEFSSKLRSIESSAFSYCQKLANIEFGLNCPLSNLEASMVFYQCISLRSIILPSALAAIDPSVFYECKSLEWIGLESGQSTGSGGMRAANGILYDQNGVLVLCPCGRLNATVTSWAKEIGERSFYGCSLLNSITFEDPSLVSTVGANTFYKCTSLKMISFPSSIQIVSSGAFSGCESLETVLFQGGEFGSSLELLGEGIFEGCNKLKIVDLMECNSLETIQSNCFKECTELAEISIPHHVKTVGASAFEGCASLNSVELGSSVESLGDSCFEGCSELQFILFPNTLKNIGKRCFAKSQLKGTLSLPASIEFVGAGALVGCPIRRILYCGTNILEENAFSETNSVQMPEVFVRSKYPAGSALGLPVTRLLDPNCAVITEELNLSSINAVFLMTASILDE